MVSGGSTARRGWAEPEDEGFCPFLVLLSCSGTATTFRSTWPPSCCWHPFFPELSRVWGGPFEPTQQYYHNPTCGCVFFREMWSFRNHQQRRRSLTKPRATPYFILPPFSPVLEDVGLTSPDPTPFSAWDTCPFQTRGLIAPPLSTFLEFPNPPPGGRSFVGFPGALEFHFRAFGDLPVATGAKGHFMFPRVQQSFCPIV